ncbi:MAG: hypothetical protein JNK72_11955 [Myxococcales bacterium]|nr:hypothetical protein [Myxococcales bacterium]
MPDFPEAQATDHESVSDALDVALTQWQRGDRVEALRWLRKAIDAAFDEGDDGRGLELSKAASALSSSMAPPAAAPSVSARPAVPPKPPTAPPPARASFQVDDDATVALSSRDAEAQTRVLPPPPPPRAAPSPPMGSPPHPAAAAVFPPPPEGGSSLSMPPVPASVAALGRSLRPPQGPSQRPPAGRVPMPPPSTPPARPAAPPAPDRASIVPGGRRNTRANRRNSRVPTGDPRPDAEAATRALPERPTEPEAEDATEVFSLTRNVKAGLRGATPPPAAATSAVLTQSVRVAVGPGPSVRLLGPREGLVAGECEAWLVATSPASDLVTLLQTGKKP